MAEYIPRGIREIVWRNKDKTRSTRYRIRIEKADFQCDRSFELLPEAVEFLALTKLPQGRLAIAQGTDSVTIREKATHDAVADALQNSPITLEDAVRGFIRVYLQSKLDSGVDKDVRTAKIHRHRLLHAMTIEIGYIKPGYAVPSGAFAGLRDKSKGFAKKPIGEFRIVDLSGQETTEYINTRIANVGGLKKTAKSTVMREIGAMQACINHLEHTDDRAWKALKGYNPFAKADKQLLKGGIRRRRKVISESEEAKLIECLSQCRNKQMPIIFGLSMETGLRRAEVLGLKWSQVNLEKGWIDLDPDLAKIGEERLIPLTQQAVDALKTLPNDREKLFTLKIEGFKTNFGRVIKRSGLENIRFHDTRRSAVYRLLSNVTSSSVAIASMLGAKSVRSLQVSTIDPLKKAAMVESGMARTQQEVMWISGHRKEETALGYTNIEGIKK